MSQDPEPSSHNSRPAGYQSFSSSACSNDMSARFCIELATHTDAHPGFAGGRYLFLLPGRQEYRGERTFGTDDGSNLRGQSGRIPCGFREASDREKVKPAHANLETKREGDACLALAPIHPLVSVCRNENRGRSTRFLLLAWSFNAGTTLGDLKLTTSQE